MDDQERQDGWEAFPDRALTAEEYATDLKLGHARPEHLAPSAPPGPALPGAAAVAKHQQVMQLPPPQWLPDSLAVSCGACHLPFRPLTRLRHHCRCCGRIFCHACSSQRALLPPKFNTRVPERVCDTCAAMLAPLQMFLAGTQAAAAQPPVHDAVQDGVSLRTWLNLPYGTTLEHDVFKAANMLAKFTQTSRLHQESAVPPAVLAGACGLVLMSLVKVGAGWSATFGTGVVVSRSSAGAWSAPCAVAAAGVGWGLQLGGELTDLLLVLRTPEAVRACCGSVHVGVGGSMGVALGPLGRSADATLLVSSAALSTPGAAYAYSCSQGAFIGVSLEGSMLTVRDSVNRAFYGLPVTATSLLVERSVAPPPAAAALYDALHALTRKYDMGAPGEYGTVPFPFPRCASTPRTPTGSSVPPLTAVSSAPALPAPPAHEEGRDAVAAGWFAADHGIHGAVPIALPPSPQAESAHAGEGSGHNPFGGRASTSAPRTRRRSSGFSATSGSAAAAAGAWMAPSAPPSRPSYEHAPPYHHHGAAAPPGGGMAWGAGSDVPALGPSTAHPGAGGPGRDARGGEEEASYMSMLFD